jgi:hypothetical protein
MAAIISFDTEGPDVPQFDDHGNVIEIRHGDGRVTVSLDGKPLADAQNDADDAPEQWYRNLCGKIDSSDLSGIVDDLLTDIRGDVESRRAWIDDRAQGIKLLGLKIEIPGTQGAADGAPVEGMSKVRHPLLLEAVVRYNANARGEFLPTDGPVKIRNDDVDAGLGEDLLATHLERMMNHYLTAVATEYYPDTDRMLFMQGFCGAGFKKVYFCPLRNRPVSESVDADDLIVNQEATDMANAQRVTHRAMLKPSTVRRLQILGVYRDIDLSDANEPDHDALKQEENEMQGLRPSGMTNVKDREREIYEVYCELDLRGFEHKWKGKASGLPLPYVVTIDVSSREALSVVRNYAEPEADELPQAHRKFVKFPFVPGLGFYDIGLLNLLGNTTNAVTAAWRLMLDNGMFANFPGFLTAKAGSRQNSNLFRVPPGGSAQVETGGLDIRGFAMPLPYNTAQMPPLMTLVENMAETGQRLGGTAETQVGEGRADVPVGTVLALIEQQIKVMNAVHKRTHSAQAEEFQLLKAVIREHPDEFLNACQRGGKKNPIKVAKTRDWLMQALDNCDLVPQADPNTSSSGQRIMKVQGLVQLAKDSPNLYDPIKVNTAALNVLGYSNPQEFFVPPEAQAAPPPQLIQAQQQMANEKTKADADMLDAQSKNITAKAVAAEKHAQIQWGPQASPPPPPEPTDPIDLAVAEAKIKDANTRELEAKIKAHSMIIEDRNRDLDRQAKERDTEIGLAKDLINPEAPSTGVGKKAKKIVKDLGKQQ